jgi:hypothetical protein
MKKTISLICALVAMILSNASAQNKSDDIPFDNGAMSISVGYGFPSVFSDLDGYTGVGPFEIGCNYHLSKKVSIGLIYTYSHATSPVFLYSDVDQFGNVSTSAYKYGVTYSTFLTRFDYFWKNSKKSAIYSGLALGYVGVSATMVVVTDGGNTASISSFSAAANGLAYHLTAVGIKYKAIDRFGVFAELGYGREGILNLGLHYSFDTKQKAKKQN